MLQTQNDQVHKENSMNLSGKTILVDGFNLELEKGTGIKTYGVSLVQALNKLGADIDVLFSRDVAQSKDPLLDEILFFDTVPEDTYAGRVGRLRKYRDSLGIFYKAMLRRPYRASALPTSDRVVKKPVQGSFVSSLADIIDLLEFHNLRNCYKQANSIFKYLKQETYVTLEKKIDIFHSTYPLPMQIKGAKKITTIHDLIPLRLPYTTLDKKPFYYELIRQSLNGSDAIATVSEHSRQDILDLFDVNPDKVKVTYQPIALKRLNEDEGTIQRFLRKYRLEYKNYILFVGAIEPKKNVGRLIDAYLGLDTDVPLVIVGKLGWLWAEEVGQVVEESGQASCNVRLLKYVSSEDLRYLFAGATCFTFPSLYEGFGLPVLEAMSFGCPVLT
ncbi:MAG: glycosyltransferase family 1 protein, partial [Leptolyngbyaceae bacterium]|nr:glycosyltransferase family 1 protein [Leptolyngbyaceae bacterium]